MQMTDILTLDGVRKTADGYLVADVRAARTGIQIYTGAEVGKPELATVRVYRPEAEVFAKDALQSFAYRPVTADHPAEMVTAENWRDVAIGQTGGEIARDGEFVRVPMVVMDAAAIRAIEGGKRELSMGYTTDLKFEDGVTPTGEKYDAIQTNLRMNHLAVVTAARGGSHLRIGDDSKGKPTMTLKTVTVDGIPIEVTDQGATVIATLQKRIADADTKLVDAEKAHQAKLGDVEKSHAAAIAAKDKDLAAKDADLAKKDAEIDALKAKVVDGAALDKLVAARAGLVATAKAIAKDVKTDGLSDAEIRRAAVVARLGEAAVKDKAEAYIDARFDILAEDAAKNPPDPFRQALRSGVASQDALTVDEDKAYAASVADLNRKSEAA